MAQNLQTRKMFRRSGWAGRSDGPNGLESCIRAREQLPQVSLPLLRQWCLRLNRLNGAEHKRHRSDEELASQGIAEPALRELALIDERSPEVMRASGRLAPSHWQALANSDAAGRKAGRGRPATVLATLPDPAA